MDRETGGQGTVSQVDPLRKGHLLLRKETYLASVSKLLGCLLMVMG